MSHVSDSDAFEYELPKVEAFDDCLSKHRRPAHFKLFEKLGDTIFTFGAYYYARDLFPDEPEVSLKRHLQNIVSSCSHAWISRHVHMEGTARTLTEILEAKGLVKQGSADFSTDYLECYLAMSFQHSPETCMKTLKHLVRVGLQHESRKNATLDLSSSSANTHTPTAANPSPTTETTSSTAARPTSETQTSPSPNANPRPPLSKAEQRKTERLVSLAHQRAQAFIKFLYTNLLFKRLMACQRPLECRTVFNAFLHNYSTHMYKTVYPKMIQTAQKVNYTTKEKIRNENLDTLLSQQSSWIPLATDIESSPEVQKFLLFAQLIILNVVRLHDHGLAFKCGRGATTWTLTLKTDPLRKLKKFAKPGDLYVWLQADQEVTEFIASQEASPGLARDNDGPSRANNSQNQKDQNQPGKRKRTGEEHGEPGNDAVGKDNVKRRKKHRCRQRHRIRRK